MTLVSELSTDKTTRSTQETLKGIRKYLTNGLWVIKILAGTKQCFHLFVIFTLTFLGIKRKEDVSIILYLVR